MTIVVNDANILIDLVELQLLPQFFALNFQFYTNTLVLDELFEEQQEMLDPYIEDGSLIAEVLSATDLEAIKEIERDKPKLSQQDCSAYIQAKQKEGTLITSDKNLRNFATSKQVDVHGHLWVLDVMVEQGSISPISASVKLRELNEVINPRLRLPTTECNKRHEIWNNQ